MRRSLCSPFLLALTAVLAGCQGESVVAPEPGISPAVGGALITQMADLETLDENVPFEGTVTLKRNSTGLLLSGQSDDLVDGDAYSIWVAIFENPGACAVTGCDFPDLFKPAVGGTLSNFGGFVANDEGTFSSFLVRHDDTRETLYGVGRSGIDNPYKAEVHIFLRSHGLAETDPANLLVQISTFLGFCNLPATEAAPDGCVEPAFAVFPVAGPPGQG